MIRLISIAVLLLSCLIIAESQTTALPRYQVPDLNGRTTLLIKPELTEKDLIDGADGSTISLRLIVDTDGNVTSATCPVSCSPSMKAAAEESARQSKFKPLIVNGEAVPFFGYLQYTFAFGRVDWFAFGTSLKSAYLFDNISLGPPAAHLTSEFGEEKARLQQLDRTGVTLETRWSTVREVVKAIKGKLKPREAWLFDLGLTLRDVTFITVLSGKTDRADLQKAFLALGPLARSAPPEIPVELVDEVRKLSTYTVSFEASEQDLRQAIRQLTMKIRPSF
ncbi:hypothetical protein BH20ACI2_BH20ACI2_02350 [soil metagenome]